VTLCVEGRHSYLGGVSFTTHEYGKGVRGQDWPRYQRRFWQHRYHDRVIRNERELEAIREYIANNPLKWDLDLENPERMKRV
jgi:putative transposase